MSELTGAEDDGRSHRHPAGRKAQLAAYVTEVGQVTVGSLAERFGVSIDTIRRDLDHLALEGLLVRTYGGAVSAAVSSRVEKAVDVRLGLQAAEKEKIGLLASQLVRDDTGIIMNGGTTMLSVARALSGHRDLTIATNNILVPAELDPAVWRELYIFGGSVRSTTLATTGATTLRVATGGADLDIRCELALIAVGAVSSQGGYTTNNVGEAAMMAEMMSRATRVAILADSSKFEKQLFAQVAPLAAADYLVTNAAPPKELRDALADAGVQVVTPESFSEVAKAG
ncbi:MULTISPECIES: DeoR/GlpR family DNA-binding transcription regulator [Arthrobacter]|uniref:DeoR/GlpR transcriptional regulator n=1 Tax=Arthrobacter terricola TaxID=2547396 RepID=A0A4R5KCP1_9MICC|nr:MULTISPECIES: DeoR/GlpR family DNA-binding transcription regulator [Arthrobacter]MBT8162266.1 DeoR/GlpR family DNA-binding transcription regulator [Arthrobacter sp. GN70]TDF92258.1 DeoR/GlpR transcriptional regulator [Arthrobacter terricola]